MREDSADIDEGEEHRLECEAVRTALVDALLRSRNGSVRSPGRTELSTLENQWVSDVARILVGEGIVPELARQMTEREGMRFVRVIRNGLARVFGRYRDRAVVSDARAQECQFAPVACGEQGAVVDMSNDGCIGKSDAPISTNESPSK